MILNDNSTQQINTLVIQLQNKITNLANEFRKLNNNINDLGSEISDLEKRVSSNENDADNNIDGLDSKINDLEKRVSSNENAAAAMNTEIEANTEAISGKADKNHTHTKSQITDFAHTHDDRYFTETEVTNKLAGKSDTGHTHDDRYFTETEVTNKLAGKSDTGHTHTKSQITDFAHTHDDRYFTETEVTNKLAGKSDTGHTHDDRYFTETEVTNKLAGKSDTGHTHTKSQITDFPTSLPANGGTATKATQDGNGNVITSTYVKKSGDTLTGPIVMKANQYTLETAQLDMKNSDIKGANAIWFDDHAEVGEGLKFPRSSGSNYDFMRLDDGKIKVAPNVTGNAEMATESIVAYTSDIPTSLPANGGTADKTVNDITIVIPYVAESGQYVIPLGNILEPTSTEINSPYNWDITGFFSIIRNSGHAGAHLWFEAGHGYAHSFTTYAYLDAMHIPFYDSVNTSIKAFQYNGKWWLGLWISTKWQGYGGKMTITYSRGLPATPTCILYYSVSNGVANKEINDSIQDIPSSWWRERVIYNPTTFNQKITAPNITSLEQRVAALESKI